MVKALEKPILALGGSGRVAGLLRAAFEITGEDRVIWQSRADVPGGICLDPLAENGMEALSEAMIGRDLIFALAGVTPATGVPLNINSVLANRVLCAAEKAGVKHVFFVSSAAVYGVSDLAHGEEEALTPVSDYGVSKQRMEEGILRADSSVQLVILRIGNIVGADQLIGRVGLQKDVMLDCFANGRGPLRSYIGPVTLARVISRLMDHADAGRELPQIINIAAADLYMDELLEAADMSYERRAAPAHGIARVIFDLARLQSLYDFAPDDLTAAGMVQEMRRLQARM